MASGFGWRRSPQSEAFWHKTQRFGIQTGVAIAFLVRRKTAAGTTIRYLRRPEFEVADDKLGWLGSSAISTLTFDEIKPAADGTWLNLVANDWGDLLPLGETRTKNAESTSKDRAILKLYAIGVSTNRDEWVISRDSAHLDQAETVLTSAFERSKNTDSFDPSIKWSRNLKVKLKRGTKIEHAPLKRKLLYRPYTDRWLLDSATFVDERGALDRYLLPDELNVIIAYSGAPAGKPFQALALNKIPSLDLLEKTKLFPRYRYTKSGERIDNITDWALNKFKARYKEEVADARFNERIGNGGMSATFTQPDGTVETLTMEPSPCAWPNIDGVPAITKDAIFAYCYAVLHNPVYREKYALNLKREFPRIPFYDHFARWVGWGQQLLDLHIGYEKLKPFKLNRIDTPNTKRAKGSHPKPKLKSDPESGVVVVDEDTQLSGIPPEAWTYRLGNRSAIDWVLDQHKEKTPRDPTIRAKFNTYRFADHKEEMIKLLAKVVTVSLETVKITDAMRALERVQDGNN